MLFQFIDQDLRSFTQNKKALDESIIKGTSFCINASARHVGNK